MMRIIIKKAVSSVVLLIVLLAVVTFTVSPTVSAFSSLSTIKSRTIISSNNKNKNNNNINRLFAASSSNNSSNKGNSSSSGGGGSSSSNSNKSKNNRPSRMSTSYTALRASVLEGLGMPSNPGWGVNGGSTRLSRLTEWADSKTANRPIVCEYEPSGFWLWKKWRGTVLKMTLRSTLVLMTVGLLLDWSTRKYILSASKTTWSLLSVPPATEPLIQSLYGLKKLWEYQLTGKEEYCI